MGTALGDVPSTSNDAAAVMETTECAGDAAHVVSLRALIAAAAAVLFASSALRHATFRSTSCDLGIFDQAVYLISRGRTPLSSFMGFHIFGDHAAWILYPIALLYVVYPTPYWLLLIQSVALALGAWPVVRLAQHAGLQRADARLLALAYLLYPVLYNANLADFHPEVIAVPALLAAVDAARRNRTGWFCGYLALVLGCKEVFGLTAAAMGLWLFALDGRRACGAIAMVTGVSWFVFVVVVVIPALTGGDAAHALGDDRYAYLGATLADIIRTTVTHPAIPLGYIFSISSLGYLAGLVSPLLWGLVPGCLGPVIGALPAVVLNLLSETRLPRHLTNWYSLPIFPFLLLAALTAMAAGRTWVRQRRVIVGWCLLGFLVFARYPRLAGYLGALDTWSATHAALSQVGAVGGVLADNCVAAHLAQRQTVYVVPFNVAADATHIPNDIEYVLLNLRHPCEWSADAATGFAQRLRSFPEFETRFQRDGVVLFQRRH